MLKLLCLVSMKILSFSRVYEEVEHFLNGDTDEDEDAHQHTKHRVAIRVSCNRTKSTIPRRRGRGALRRCSGSPSRSTRTRRQNRSPRSTRQAATASPLCPRAPACRTIQIQYTTLMYCITSLNYSTHEQVNNENNNLNLFIVHNVQPQGLSLISYV